MAAPAGITSRGEDTFFNANGNYGVYVQASSGLSTTVNIKNSNVTNHSTGIYRYTSARPALGAGMRTRRIHGGAYPEICFW